MAALVLPLEGLLHARLSQHLRSEVSLQVSEPLGTIPQAWGQQLP